MNGKLVLEMIENGKIEELKKAAMDEIYQKEISSTPGAKQRYTAMKRYFKYADDRNDFVCKPKQVEELACFCDGLTAVRTTESLNDLQQFDDTEKPYIDLNKIMGLESVSDYTEEINFNEILAEAKSKGYKYKKSEVGRRGDFTTVFLYNNAFFKVGLLDQAFSIINDGNKAIVYSTGKSTSLIKIVTSIGECILLPLNINHDSVDDKTIIKVESKHDSKIA